MPKSSSEMLMPTFFRLWMMVSTWSRSSSSEPSVISISSRFAGKPVVASTFRICSASVGSRNWTGETLTASFRCAGQLRASFSACSMTLMVSGPMSPVRSAASMKFSASSKPAVRRAPAGERLESDDLRGFEVDQRLEEGHELAALMPRRMSSSSFSRSDSSSSSCSSNQAKPFRPRVLGGIERDVAVAKRGLLVVAARSIRARPIEAETWICVPSTKIGAARCC